jgi:hypothetical protein
MAARLSALRAGRPLPPRKILGTHFCYRLSQPQGHSAAGRIRSVGKIYLIGTRTHNLPVCNKARQLTTLPRARATLDRQGNIAYADSKYDCGWTRYTCNITMNCGGVVKWGRLRGLEMYACLKRQSRTGIKSSQANIRVNLDLKHFGTSNYWVWLPQSLLTLQII